jgi:hypothetical protein
VNAAEELRAAAAKLRLAAAPADCVDEWAEFYASDEDVSATDRAWIALLSPALAEPLALWLESEARDAEEMDSGYPQLVGEKRRAAVAVAYVINGGGS